MEIRVTVNVHAEDDGSFWAEVEEFPGCFASARDRAQLVEAVKDAVDLYIQDGDVSREALRALAVERVDVVEAPLAPVVPLAPRQDSPQGDGIAHIRLVVEG